MGAYSGGESARMERRRVRAEQGTASLTRSRPLFSLNGIRAALRAGDIERSSCIETPSGRYYTIVEGRRQIVPVARWGWPWSGTVTVPLSSVLSRPTVSIAVTWAAGRKTRVLSQKPECREVEREWVDSASRRSWADPHPSG